MSVVRKHSDPNPSFAAPTVASALDVLVAASGIVARDRVVVVGHKTLDHLLALVRIGCWNAAAIRPEAAAHLIEAADVVWVTDVAGNDELETIIHGVAAPRIVAFELPGDGAKGDLRRLLGKLRAKGLVETSIYHAADGSVIVTTRPTWLRCVIESGR